MNIPNIDASHAAMVLPIRQSESVTTPFYLHPLDWVPAKEIFMTKEQFGRFFEVDPDTLESSKEEVIDVTEIGIEFHGFKIHFPNRIRPTYIVQVQYFPHNPHYESLNFDLMMGVSRG